MAILTQTFEGGTNGVEITSGNTTGGGNAIASIKGAGGSVAFTSVGGEVINGAMSVKCYAPSGLAAYANWAGSGTMGGFFAKHRLPAVTAQTAVQIIRSSGNRKMAQVEVAMSRRLIFSMTTGAIYTTPTALTLPGVYYIDIAVDSGTNATDGKSKFAVYDSSGNLAGGMTAPVEFTGNDTGAGETISYFQVGKCNGPTDSSNYFIDDLRAVTGSYAFGAVATNVATLRPTSLINNTGNWTFYGGASSLDGALSDSSDTTGIRTPDNPTNAATTVAFAGELAAGDATVKIKVRYTGGPGTITLRLLTSTGTVVATGTAQAVSGSLATYQLVLSPGENTAIASNRTGLRLEITGNAT